MKKKNHRSFFGLVVLLTAAGFFIFSSAALGLYGRAGPSFLLVVSKQFLILMIGLFGCLLVSKVHYRRWRQYGGLALVVSLVLTLFVFVPEISLAAGGARRWIDLKVFSFQPSEFLKIGFIIYLALWLSKIQNQVRSWRRGFMPLALALAVLAALLLKQPDLGTFLTIFAAAAAMFMVAGAKWSQLGAMILLALTATAALAWYKPYVRDRLTTFLNPEHDQLGAAYQINQSLIAIGSGGRFGRGFGQSVQKFHFLPEPIGDSIFAVAGEEFGFAGTGLLVIFLIVFGIWGLTVAARAPDAFGRLLAVGIVILISAGALANIASMIGLAPVVGVPLSFVSHGGTALLVSLFGVGLLLGVARQQT